MCPPLPTFFNPVNDNKYSPEGRGILSPLTMVISTSESLRSGNELEKKTKQNNIREKLHSIFTLSEKFDSKLEPLHLAETLPQRL